jgi:glycine betaine catabolism B
LSLFTKTTMVFSTMREIEDGAHVFTFTPAKPLVFTAGQHGVLRIAGVDGRRAFSLASAPEDPEVVIATRLQSHSDFKLALAALMPGDPVTLNGPILNFTLRGTPDDVVFLAQGIGITPFRAMLRHIAAVGDRKRTHLVHVGGTGDPPFRSETEPLATTSLYLGDRDAYAVAIEQLVTNQPDASYFISGAVPYVKDTASRLSQLGVTRRQIRKDTFFGY